MVGFSRTKKRLAATTAFAFGCCLVAALPGCKSKQFDSMEAPAGCIETLSDTVSIPTAGLRGIDLTPGTVCTFQINLREGHSLFWDDFVRQFPNANVMISLEIDRDGSVARWVDEDDGQQPAALTKVKERVETWRWEGGCLYGVICFVFNTAESQVYIDDSRLIEMPGCGEGEIIRNQLHRVYRDRLMYYFWESRREVCY